VPGLLVDLEGLAQAADLGSLVQGAAGNVQGIIATVSQLMDGPPELEDFTNLIGSVPLPPGLDGLASVVPTLTGIVEGAPSDTLGPLAAILGPLEDLVQGDGLSVGINVSVTASLDALRALLELVTGRMFGGASGMPLAALLWGRQGMPAPQHPDLATVRARLGEVTSVIDQAVGTLDAGAVLALLRRAAGAFAHPSPKWPTIPVLTETMEALHTVGAWQDMDGPTLTASLRHTLEQVAVLVATPRTRVAQPYLDAAAHAGAAPETLAAARAALQPLITGLRDKVLVTGVLPTSDELRALEAQVVALEALASALSPDGPLADADALPAALEQQMLRVVRALMPAYDMRPLAEKIRERFAAFPAAPEAPLADLVQAVNDVDLSVITGPLQAVKNAVEGAVDAVNAAKDAVRAALEALLAPVDNALTAAMEALHLQEIIDALAGLPATVQDFLDNQVMSQVEVVRDAITGAVSTVSGAADLFDPEALLGPIKDALQAAATRLSESEVKAVFQQVGEALDQAIAALENLDLTPAADESIARMQAIEEKLAAIDPSLIPDSAKPLLRQAVQVVTEVDFTGDVATPIVRGVEAALEAGPATLLATLDEAMDQLRERIEAFKPSQVVAEALDEPFQQLMSTLHEFEPSALLERIDEALEQIAAQVNIADVGAVLGPIEEIHEQLVSEMEKLKPSKLLEPVEAAIEAAVAKVFEVARIDDVFDGLDDVLGTINDTVGLLDDTRDGLDHLADLLADLGSSDAALTALVDTAVSRLDDVALAGLQEAFEDVAAAVASVRRDALAGDVARGFQRAADRVPGALASADAEHLRTMAQAFPRAALTALGAAPPRRRLSALIGRLDRATAGIVGAREPWQRVAEHLALHAGRIQEDLLRYYRVTLIEGGTVLDDLAVAPASTAALRAAVADALEDGLREPVSMVLAMVATLAPYVEKVARDLGAFVGAVHDKIDSITGEDGLAGTVDAVEEVADLLRDIDLTPITDPLDAIWGRIQGAVQGLDPTPLRQALEAVRDALTSLLDLSTLIDDETIAEIDDTYAEVLEKIESLSPSKVISETLDPLYEELLATIVPVLEMPGKLRDLVETATRDLPDELLAELGRVEEAFDRMLQAIPLDGSGSGASGSISVSASTG
jgi:hypothetical protein